MNYIIDAGKRSPVIINPGAFEIFVKLIFFTDIVVIMQHTCCKTLSKTSWTQEYRNFCTCTIFKIVNKSGFIDINAVTFSNLG